MIPSNKDTIYGFGGQVLGYVESDNKGNKQVRDFYGRVLGYYDKTTDTTRDFYGRVISRGDSVIGFIYQNK